VSFTSVSLVSNSNVGFGANGSKLEIVVSFAPFHGAKLTTISNFDPFAPKPTFEFDTKLTDVKLTELNDFLRAYGRFDVKNGNVDLYSELAASDGAFRGYVKLLVDDLDVVELKEDIKNPIILAWKGVVSGVYHLFRNQRTGKFATRVPFSGTFDDPRARVWPTIGNVFWNAFIKALPPKLEHSINLDTAREEERKQKP